MQTTTQDPAQLRRHIQDLEKRLAQTIIQRDDLARDVENLCLQDNSSNTTFNASSVLQERIYATDKELSKFKTELVEATSDLESTKEDLREIKEAKRIIEKSFKEQSERLAALERELSFYRQQAAAAVAERDNFSWEVEELRTRCSDAEEGLKRAETTTNEAVEERLEAVRRSAKLAEQVAALEQAATQAAMVPALREQLSTARAEVDRLRSEQTEVTANLEDARRDNEQAEQHIAVLEADRRTVTQQSDAEFEDVARQKVEALMRLSEAEAGKSAALNQVQRLQTELEVWKAKAQQAMQEKVAALMEVAELKGNAHAAVVQGGTPEKSAAGSYAMNLGGWNIFGNSNSSPLKPTSPQQSPSKP